MTFWKKLSERLSFPDKSIIPSNRLLILLGCGIGCTTVGSWMGIGWLIFFLFNGAVLAFVAIDCWYIRRLPVFTATRKLESLFEIDEENSVIIEIESAEPVVIKMWVQDDFPDGFQVSDRTFALNWKQDRTKTICYTAKPHRRGRHLFQQIHLRMESKLKLLLIQQAIPEQTEVLVFPRLQTVRKVRKGVYRRQSMTDGTPMPRFFGTGKEFSYIREYLPDDEPRNINWSGTARQGKLVSNVYQPEIGQQVAILLDCGRMMGVQNEGLSQLDQALEAILGYAAIALQRGDHVSFLAFSDKILRWVPIGKGMAHLQAIIEASFDLESSYVESDYFKAWSLLANYHKKKTLVTLFTDIANLSFSETMSSMIMQVRKKHLMMTVSMQDPRLKERWERLPQAEEDVYERLVIEQLQAERKQALLQWGTKKVVTLDVEPEQLANAVIYSYLEIRNRAVK